jgi:hypothetical protein
MCVCVCVCVCVDVERGKGKYRQRLMMRAPKLVTTNNTWCAAFRTAQRTEEENNVTYQHHQYDGEEHGERVAQNGERLHGSHQVGVAVK